MTQDEELCKLSLRVQGSDLIEHYTSGAISSYESPIVLC